MLLVAVRTVIMLVGMMVMVRMVALVMQVSW